jgi:hypothetical protein
MSSPILADWANNVPLSTVDDLTASLSTLIASKVDLVLPGKVGPERIIAFLLIKASSRDSLVDGIMLSFCHVIC